MKRRSCTPVVALVALVVAQLSCGAPSSSRFHSTPTVFPTIAPTQTAVVVTVRETVVVLTTSTPKPTPTATRQTELCVSVTQTVYLRPASSENGYPILPLKDGTIVRDLGGRDGNWMFVEVKDKRGWINKKYLSNCK